MEFSFTHSNDDTLMVRMPQETAEKIRAIAVAERVSIQEVCRTFLIAAVKEYESHPGRQEKK